MINTLSSVESFAYESSLSLETAPVFRMGPSFKKSGNDLTIFETPLDWPFTRTSFDSSGGICRSSGKSKFND